MYSLSKVHVFTEEIRSVLADCMYQPNAQKLTTLVQLYQTNPERVFYSYIDESARVVAVIGCQLIAEEKTAVILHIAVHQAFRGAGIGRQLIDAIISLHALARLEAETDADAIGFYRSAGFAISSLGERYPGVERFLCVKQLEPRN